MIYFTSDWHFNHDREFIYRARGFDSVERMNEEIVRRHNHVVTPEDTVIVLGDLCLGGSTPEKVQKNKELIEQMNGRLIVVCGNHDTENRRDMYCECKNIVSVVDAFNFNEQGYHFFCTHYPCFTANLEKDSLKQCTINLFGHTHQNNNFFYDVPFMYHVGVDSHNCFPVSFEEAIADMQKKVQECFDKV